MDYPSLADVAASVEASTLALWTLTTAVVFALGYVLYVMAAKRLVDGGYERKIGYGNSIALVFVGTLFLFLGQSIKSGTKTLYGDDGLMAYAPETVDWTTEIMAAVIIIVRFFGLLAFVRGGLRLCYCGHETSLSMGAVSQSLVFMGFGIAAMNIVFTTEVVLWTLRLLSPLQ